MSNFAVALRWNREHLSRQALLETANRAVRITAGRYVKLDVLKVQAIPDEEGQYVQLVIQTDAAPSECEEMRRLLKETFERETEPATCLQKTLNAGQPDAPQSSANTPTRTASNAIEQVCAIGQKGTTLGTFFDFRNERPIVQFSPKGDTMLIAFRSSVDTFAACSGTPNGHLDLQNLFAGSVLGSSTPYAIFADVVGDATLLGVACDNTCTVIDPFKGLDQTSMKITAGALFGTGFSFHAGGVAQNRKGVLAGLHFKYIAFDMNKPDAAPEGIDGTFANVGVALSPQGEYFAAIPQQGDTVDIRLLDGGKKHRAVRHSGWFTRMMAHVNDVKFMPKTSDLLVAHRKASGSQHLSMWNAASGALMWTCTIGGEPTTAVRLAIADDGRLILSSEGKLVRVRDASTGNAVGAIDAPEGGCVALVWAPHSSVFATVGKKGRGALYRVRD